MLSRALGSNLRGEVVAIGPDRVAPPPTPLLSEEAVTLTRCEAFKRCRALTLAWVDYISSLHSVIAGQIDELRPA